MALCALPSPQAWNWARNITGAPQHVFSAEWTTWGDVAQGNWDTGMLLVEISVLVSRAP